jgi:hypothetical protein
LLNCGGVKREKEEMKGGIARMVRRSLGFGGRGSNATSV